MSDPTVRQQIREAAIALLNTGRPNTLPPFTKRRYVPGERVREQRCAVFFVAEPAERFGSSKAAPGTLRRLVIAAQVVDSVEDPEEADDAVEPALAWITEKLGNTNLAGLVHDIEQTGTVWETDSKDLFYVAATTTWRVEYHTLRNDLTKRS